MLTRREMLLLLAGLMCLPAGPAFAKKDGGSGSGGGDDDDDSGSGGGGDDDDDDDDDGGSGGGDGNKGGKRGAKSARDAVKRGKAASLRDVLRLVRNKYPGRVINVGVSESGDNLIYSIKLIDQRNRRMQIRVNANQRRIIGAKFI